MKLTKQQTISLSRHIEMLAVDNGEDISVTHIDSISEQDEYYKVGYYYEDNTGWSNWYELCFIADLSKKGFTHFLELS